MQRITNLVDLEKCCKMSIWSQKSALIQKRKSVLKFDDLAEKSEKDSISNFRTKEKDEDAAPSGSRASQSLQPDDDEKVPSRLGLSALSLHFRVV